MQLTNIKDINALLTRHGFRFSKSMGQNFLTAGWVPEQIAESAGLGEGVGVLEIGPGIGCLTEQLALRADKVICVELDEALRPVLAETMGEKENVEIVFGDVLKQDIPALVAEKLAGLRAVVCANLPYNVTSPVLDALMQVRCFEKITVMIQKEAAQRLCAKAGSAAYNASSVYAQWFTEPEILFDVSPDCFVPQPKVTSSVISLTPRKTPIVPVLSEKVFLRVVHAAFAQRRKTLVNALAGGFGKLDKAALTRAALDAGLDERVRGEALSIAEFAALADCLARAEQE